MRLFDLHCDTLYECYTKDVSLDKNTLHVDMERGSKFDRWIQVFAVWMPDSVRGEEAWRQCAAILQSAHHFAARYPQMFQIACKAENLNTESSSPVCTAILAVEGGSALNGDLLHSDDLSKMDVKVITITWNGSNELGHGCGSGCTDGLTAFGKAAVRRMEELGIIPDVSHLNEQGFWDVAAQTKRPFIASHSVSAAVHPHVRNLTDAQFLTIVERGGLVGLNLCEQQLGARGADALERHLYHYLCLGGEHTVALGCDLDGTDLPPEWGGIQVMPLLYEALLRKNYEESLVDRLFFGNCYDFFTQL